jgi:hypothetical protein
MPAEDQDSVSGIGGFKDVVPCVRKQRGCPKSDYGFIIDDQNAAMVRHALPLGLTLWWVGSITTNSA